MTETLEWCREWLPGTADNCHQPAAVIIWGKLFPPEALGPKCEEHAVGLRYDQIDQLVIDLLTAKRDHEGESA